MGDRAAMLDQEFREQLARVLQLDIRSSYANLTFPDPVAGKFLQWKDLTAIQNADVLTLGQIGVPVVVAQGGTGGTSISTAQTNLGVFQTGRVRGLQGTNTAATPNTQFDLSAIEVVVRDPTDGRC